MTWIQKIEHDHIDEDARKVFKDYDTNSDGFLQRKEFTMATEIRKCLNKTLN